MAQLYASSAHHDAHKPSPNPLIVCCPCMFHRIVSRVNSTCSILLLVARDSIFLHSSLLLQAFSDPKMAAAMQDKWIGG